jgi:hypothetical protein
MQGAPPPMTPGEAGAGPSTPEEAEGAVPMFGRTGPGVAFGAGGAAAGPLGSELPATEDPEGVLADAGPPGGMAALAPGGGAGVACSGTVGRGFVEVVGLLCAKALEKAAASIAASASLGLMGKLLAGCAMGGFPQLPCRQPYA